MRAHIHGSRGSNPRPQCSTGHDPRPWFKQYCSNFPFPGHNAEISRAYFFQQSVPWTCGSSSGIRSHEFVCALGAWSLPSFPLFVLSLCFLVLCLFLPFSISASFVLFLSFDYVSLSHYFIFPFLFCAFHCFFLFSLSFFTYLITSSFSLFVFYQLFSSFSSLFLSLSFLISVPFFLSLPPLSRIHYFYLAVCLILFIRFSPPPFSLLCSFLSLSFFQFPSYISSFRYLLSIPLYISFFLSSFLPSQLTISAMTSVRQR
jgi:hypothetical protein